MDPLPVQNFRMYEFIPRVEQGGRAGEGSSVVDYVLSYINIAKQPDQQNRSCSSQHGLQNINPRLNYCFVVMLAGILHDWEQFTKVLFYCNFIQVLHVHSSNSLYF